MNLENLTLISTSAALELSVATEGSSSCVKMQTKLSEDHQPVFTDGALNVGQAGVLVTVFCQGDDGVEIPKDDEDSIGTLRGDKKRCRLTMSMRPAQFERLQQAVMIGASFELFVTIDTIEASSGSEIILRTSAHEKLPVLDVVFTAEPRR